MLTPKLWAAPVGAQKRSAAQKGMPVVAENDDINRHPARRLTQVAARLTAS